MKVTPVNRKFGRYAPGDEFEMPDKAARPFVRVGKLREVAAEVAPIELAPVEVEASEPQETAAPVRRQYRRRDLSAEG